MVVRGPKCKALRLLSKDEVEAIHAASLEVLEHVGMHSDSHKILEIFREIGAEVDFRKKRIKIPQHLVEEALKKTPKRFIFCGRNPKNDILLENGRVYFGMGGTPVPYVRDLETGEFRTSTKKDFQNATKLGDALPNMSFLMGIAGAFDMPKGTEFIHEWEALFTNTSKPIIYSAPSGEYARWVIRMASAIVGGLEELKKRPIMSIYSETASPLSFTDINDNMIECAKAGIPVTLGPAPIMGASAPATLAGATVVGNAESLAALTLIQAVNPHSPIIYAAWAVVMDPRSGAVVYGAPEHSLTFGVINGQIAEYYNLPSFGLGGATDSKVPDAQAGAEIALSLLMNALAGVNLIHDCGYLASGRAGSMEMAVICDEVAGYVLRMIRRIEVNDETLAVDVIKAVGPREHFFTQKHTFKYIEREIYLPKIFDRKALEIWIREGMKDVATIAREKAKKILEEHEPDPLPKDVRETLSRIVKEAEEKLVKKEK